MGNFNKPYEELLFTDNFMFVYMMEHYPDLCREMLELILPVKIDRVESVSTEHSIDNAYESKGVRLDALMKDSSDNIYDVEMQVVVESDLPKRSRYYHSAIDIDFLSKNSRYSDIKPVYVIFICKEKLGFTNQAPVYIFRSIDSDTGEILPDMRYTVFVNSDYINQNECDIVSDELSEFLYLVNKGKTRIQGGTFANKIENMVKEIKKEKKWRAKYMTIYEQMLLDLEEHKEEWQEEAWNEGRTEGQLYTLIELVENGYITSELAAKTLNITIEEFNQKVNECMTCDT